VSESESGEIEARVARLEAQEDRLTRALELLAERAAAPAAPARKSGRDWDAYAAVIASFIGILALAASGYTAYVQRQRLRAQVWPHLQIHYSSVNPQFFVSNHGTGPARITAARVTVDYGPVKTWTDVMKAVGLPDNEGVGHSDLGELVLSPDKDFTIVQPTNDQGRANLVKLLPGGKHLVVITLCYCSVLEDCWFTGSNDTVGPREGCPILPTERFRN
jgi:hypothetical protein